MIRFVLLALAGIAYHGLALWDPRSHAYTPIEGFLFEASETAPQVVFLIAAVLLARRRDALRRSLGGEPAPALAGLCLVPGVALHLWSQLVAAPDLLVPSLALVALGAALLLAGKRFARELAPCLAVLAFAAPLPGALHNGLVWGFQLATAHGAEWALQALGYTAVRQGDTLWIGRREFEVIETCSGLRAAQTLALLAVAWAVFFGCRLRHAALLVATAPFIAYATNVARVMVLVVDPRREVQEAHTPQGIVMFVVGSLSLVLVDQLLLRLLPRDPRPPVAVPERPAGGGPRRRREARILSLGLAVMALGALSGWRRPAPAPPPVPPPELPRELPGWDAADGPQHGQFLGTVRALRTSSVTYSRGEDSVWAFLAWDDLQERSRSLLSEKNALPGLGWEVEEQREVVLEPGGVRMEAVVALHFGKRSLALHAHRGAGTVLVETLRAGLALDQAGSPFARREGVSLLRLGTYVPGGADGIREAESLLRALFADLAPRIAWSRGDSADGR